MSMSPIPREITEAGAWLEASYRRADFQTDCFPQLARQALQGALESGDLSDRAILSLC